MTATSAMPAATTASVRLLRCRSSIITQKTVRPAAYPTGVGGWSRPPHIHFDIKGRANRLVTQMYFAGEALNEKDRLFAATNAKETLLARASAPSGKPERDALVAAWDVVLNFG